MYNIQSYHCGSANETTLTDKSLAIYMYKKNITKHKNTCAPFIG